MRDIDPLEHYERRRQKLFADQDGICPCGDQLPIDFVIDFDYACCQVPVGSEACGKCDLAAMCPPCRLAVGMLLRSADRLRALSDWLESLDG